MNVWAGLALVLVLAWGGKSCYDAGSRSRDQEVADAHELASGEQVKVGVLQKALNEQNAKVLQFAKDQQEADSKRQKLREQALVEGAADEARVTAAEAITTSAGDVLRANWGTDE